IAMPGGILQTRLRREAHSRIDRAIAMDSAHGRASAQMAAHQSQRTAEHGGSALADVLVRSAMEPIAGHAGVAPGSRYAILAGEIRHRAMKLSLERGHQRCAR